MKKLFLIALMVMAGYSAKAQFSAGVYGALPVGDAGDFSSFGLGVDLTYLFDVADTFGVGPTVGVAHFFTDDIETPVGTVEITDVTFLPVALAGRFHVSDAFTLGADLGYGVGINDGNDGGFYYAPRVAYSVSDLIDIALTYRGVSQDGSTWSWLGLGLEFGID